MTQFNPENKETMTYGESLGPAMKITDQEDADHYFQNYSEFIQKHLDVEPRNDGATAEQIAKGNLGYFAGYYDHETRVRVEKLFRCSHPVFGDASSGPPSAEEAFAAGKKIGMSLTQTKEEPMK